MANRRRSLIWRIAWLGLAVFAGMGIIQFTVLGLSASLSFGEVEDRLSIDHAQRTVMALQVERDSLLDLVRENALWDEMYALVKKGRADSLTELLPPAWMDIAGLDFVLLRQSEDRVLWSGLRLDPSSDLQNVSIDSLPAIGRQGALSDRGMSDIVQTTNGPLIIASMPVRDTAMSRPDLGSLTFGRYLTRRPLVKIADRLRMSIGLAVDGKAPGRRLVDQGGNAAFIRDEGDRRIVFVPISTGTNAPMMFRLEYTRSSAIAAQRLLVQTGLAYLVTACLALFATFAALRRLALHPILRIATHLDRAALGPIDRPLNLGAAAGRVDEIGILADRVDQLIVAEQLTTEKLRAVNQELERRASTDALTGLANRRFFAERLEREKRRIMRERQGPDLDEIAFVVCDIDFFKRYNDRYGHRAGDACLRAVAEAIAGALDRPSDFASRHGGEEFLVMLPGTNEAGGIHVAENIREGVESLGLPHEDSIAAPHVTLSLGVAARRVDEGFDSDALFQLADEAMYRAKAAGRNRVVASGVTTPQGPPLGK
jgi:diguanylate cyclase (GGDEF)-like protein